MENNSGDNSNNNVEKTDLSLSLSWPRRPTQPTPFQQMFYQQTPSQPKQILISPQTSLTLPFQISSSSSSTHAPLVSPSTSTNPLDVPGSSPSSHPPRPLRTRRAPINGKSDTIRPPFPWATDHRATVHSLEDLMKKQIFKISGEVQCKRCERKFEMEFDLEDKFDKVCNFFNEHRSNMHDRAPDIWMNPTLPTCNYCGQENSVHPIIANKKKSINWLFLLLGQMLGCCKLEQLKYFCKHTNQHRTGAKDRVLYLTYLGLCKQLDPDG